MLEASSGRVRVLLIEPPFWRLQGIEDHIFPMGVGYLAAVLERRGHAVGILNADIGPVCRDDLAKTKGYGGHLASYHSYIRNLRDVSGPIWQDIAGTMREFNPDIVGISTMTQKLGSAVRIAALAKTLNPECIVVLGGQHPTILPDEVLQQDDVDFVVRGEGEETIVELVDALIEERPPLSSVLGLSFRKDGEVVHNPRRPLIRDLDVLPFPARHLMLRGGSQCMYAILASRGCPYECGFCGSRNVWERRVRYRSIGSIIREMKLLIDTYHIETIHFWDDSFTLNRRRVVEFCRRLVAEGIKVKWASQSRIEVVDSEMLKVMKIAGCVLLAVGVEVGSEKVLRQINKRITLDQIARASEMLGRSGIQWVAFMMIGFPDETEEDIAQTVDLMKRIRPDEIALSIFTPYPGTELYRVVQDYGLMPSQPEWSLFSHQSPYNHFTREIDREKFRGIIADVARWVDRYNSIATLKARLRAARVQPAKVLDLRKVYAFVRVVIRVVRHHFN